MIVIFVKFRIGGVAFVDPDSYEVHVRPRPVERVPRQSGGVSGMFAVSRHGPKRSPGARQIRGAAGAAVAVRRHSAGRRRDGDPQRRVPSDGRRGRVRRPYHQLAGRVPCVRLQSDAERQEVRSQRRAVHAGHRPDDSARLGQRRGRPTRGRLGNVPRWSGG